MRLWILLPGLCLVAAACGSPVTTPDAATKDAGSSTDSGTTDGGTQDSGTPDSGTQDSGTPDSGTPDSGSPDAGPSGTYRTSLHVCWNDPSCQRALAIAHGGEWNLSNKPYDSNAALDQAYQDDFDGVKVDVRVTSDDVPVISHSSPIESYESLDCSGLVIENSTAAQVTQCHRQLSSETFQRLDDVLNAMRGKLVVQLSVKRPQDYQRTVDEVKALNAQDFAFIEINAGDMTTWVPQLTNAADVFFLVNLASDTSQVAPLLALRDPRAFMFEFDPGVNLSSITPNQLHPARVRSFTYDSSALLSVSQARTYFESGSDVVSANTGTVAKDARVQVNQARGISPP